MRGWAANEACATQHPGLGRGRLLVHLSPWFSHDEQQRAFFVPSSYSLRRSLSRNVIGMELGLIVNAVFRNYECGLEQGEERGFLEEIAKGEDRNEEQEPVKVSLSRLPQGGRNLQMK